MQPNARLALALLATVWALGCGKQPPLEQPDQHRDEITQVSIINALMLAEYDGIMPLGDVLKFGDFGLGTVDHLDGELIILEGQAFQARSDGKIALLEPSVTTPFAIVTNFETDGELTAGRVSSLTELDNRLDSQLPNTNIFYAIRVDAEFLSITFRSVPRQEPPYKPLADVSKSQSVFTHESIRGTLIGVRCPEWAKGVTVPGYHWHFIDSERRTGGHVLDCQLHEGEIKYDRCSVWRIELDDKLGTGGKNLSADLSKDLDQVERSRGDSTR